MAWRSGGDVCLARLGGQRDREAMVPRWCHGSGGATNVHTAGWSSWSMRVPFMGGHWGSLGGGPWPVWYLVWPVVAGSVLTCGRHRTASTRTGPTASSATAICPRVTLTGRGLAYPERSSQDGHFLSCSLDLAATVARWCEADGQEEAGGRGRQAQSVLGLLHQSSLGLRGRTVLFKLHKCCTPSP